MTENCSPDARRETSGIRKEERQESHRIPAESLTTHTLGRNPHSLYGNQVDLGLLAAEPYALPSRLLGPLGKKGQ